MPDRERQRAAWVAGAVGLVVAALQLSVAHRYGIFRDELYFLDCGQRLQWGYVDQPPLVALLARAATLLAGGQGGSLTLLRLLPALCHGALCVLCARLAVRLGGGAFAALLAALAPAAGAVYLVHGHLLSMNIVEQLIWLGCASLLAEALLRDDPRPLAPLGALCGLGVLDKFSMVFFAAALLLALLLVPERRLLRSRPALLGAVLAVLIAAPTLLWQLAHGLPQLELLRNGQLYKNAPITPLQFTAEQLVNEGPVALLLALAGLFFLLRGRELPRLRALGFAFAIVFAIIALLHGKAYYAAPAFPMLFAAGGVQAEQALRALWLRATAALVLTAQLALMALLALPILAPAEAVALSRRLGIAPRHEARGRYNDLPQFAADQFGWPELARDVALVWERVPPQQRAGAAIFGQNYGEAGAVNWFGPALGLPRALSGHNEYFRWSQERLDAGPPVEWALVIGDDEPRLRQLFRNVELALTHRSQWAMPEETELPIWLCSAPRRPLREIWPQARHYQ